MNTINAMNKKNRLSGINVKAILFDLDGTLLPMNQEKFTYGYFKELAGVISPLGIEAKALVDIVWAGTKAMVQNTGKKTNETVFWDTFATLSKMDISSIKPACDRFYTNEFHRTRVFTGENPLAPEAIHLAHANDRKVILASNPIFPLSGHVSRMSWVGLKPESFDLITSYETESYCKPNPDYYSAICKRIGLTPEECLMIGNDETEDMYAASSIGMNGFLVTDCLIPSKDYRWEGPRGTFSEMLDYIREL